MPCVTSSIKSRGQFRETAVATNYGRSSIFLVRHGESATTPHRYQVPACIVNSSALDKNSFKTGEVFDLL